MSWDLIMPFLQPLEPWLKDPDVSDILVNGGGRVFVEKSGRMEALPEVVMTERSLEVAARHIARVLGDDISPDQPLLDARLPDGSRVAAVLAPCSVTGTILAIRKFQGQRYSAQELVRTGSLMPEALAMLQAAVDEHRNILISGGTGTGKTTLLNALAGLIDRSERIIVIEDTAEIQIPAGNVVRLEARREQPGMPAVTMRDLLRTTLRLRPDRILLGEVRGGEAFDLLQALNTGHSGTLATLHANSAAQAIARFTTCVLQSGVELPYRAIRSNIAEALNCLIHIERRQGHRRVSQILSIQGYDAALDRYDLACQFGAES
jgi:pilus assembly protein CpaF